MSFALHLSSDGRSSHLLPPLLFPGEIQVLSQVHVCASQVPTAQTGWRREGDLRILTHSSLQSSSLQKTLLSYTTSHLMAMLLASLTAPPTPHSQEWVMLFLCSVLAIPVSVQMSLALTWIYFSLDSFYFQPANIHFIPEVTHVPDDAIQFFPPGRNPDRGDRVEDQFVGVGNSNPTPDHLETGTPATGGLDGDQLFTMMMTSTH